MVTKVSAKLGNEEVAIETGKLAKQADGSVLIQCGGTVVLVTAVSEKEVGEDQDFFPLTVDYREKTYAAGKIPGGFFKREGRPTEKEILTSRLIDRPMRPLFPSNYLNEVQISAIVLSVDGENNPDTLAMVGASASLMISGIPFETPVGSVRVGMIGEEFVINPTYAQMEESKIDLILAATEKNVTMIEAGVHELSEETVLKAIQFGFAKAQELIKAQKELAAKCGKPKSKVPEKIIPESVKKQVKEKVGNEFSKIFKLQSKEERADARTELYKTVLASFNAEAPDFKESNVKYAFDSLEEQFVRVAIADKHQRPDGRQLTEIRKITCETGILPRTHGSSLFTRGETQSLATATLGSGQDEQRIDSLEGETFKQFMLHYNFPPFSVGETGPNRGPGRREIGHGALAERALKAVIPSQEEFPYTIRVVSEILESNGSSSMASVCAGTLALMDAGVPITSPVSGIAMGLVTEGDKWCILTDIAGVEDHLGDMDFKVAGTKKGITALQMDIKISGISEAIIKKALEDSKVARLKILDIMLQTVPETKKDLSEFAPRITTVRVNPDKIGELIGPGGKNIKKIIAESGAKVDIEDDGRVNVSSNDPKAVEIALRLIGAISEEAEVGKIYQAKVRKIAAFGAFCEILPGTDGLVHVSEIAEGFVKKVDDYLKLGDIVPVKVINIDENGKISLSRIKALKELGITDTKTAASPKA